MAQGRHRAMVETTTAFAAKAKAAAATKAGAFTVSLFGSVCCFEGELSPLFDVSRWAPKRDITKLLTIVQRFGYLVLDLHLVYEGFVSTSQCALGPRVLLKGRRRTFLACRPFL